VLAQKTRYALRSLLFLAEAGGSNPVQLARIAETQRVPPKYLELIMLDLKKAGLVKSARGPKGGYQLSRRPELISFGEFVRSMEGPIALVACVDGQQANCSHSRTCQTQGKWDRVNGAVKSALAGVRLTEMVAPKVITIRDINVSRA